MIAIVRYHDSGEHRCETSIALGHETQRYDLIKTFSAADSSDAAVKAAVDTARSELAVYVPKRGRSEDGGKGDGYALLVGSEEAEACGRATPVARGRR